MPLSIADKPLADIASNAVQIVRVGGSATDLAAKWIFPGAFDPLHVGHREMAELAERRLGCCVAFEISIENVDKPDLTSQKIKQRLAQFDASQTVFLTRAARFTEKTELFPRPRFIVGADTITRIGDAKYYGDDSVACDRAIDILFTEGVRFLVFGRLIDGVYESAATLLLPRKLGELCEFVSEQEFRRDISSTQLRQ